MMDESLIAKLRDVTLMPINLRKTLYHGGAIESPEACANGLWLTSELATAKRYANWKGTRSPKTYVYEVMLNTETLNMFVLPIYHYDFFREIGVPDDTRGYHQWLKLNLSEFCIRNYPHVHGFISESRDGVVSMSTNEIFVFRPSDVLSGSTVLKSVPGK